MKEIINLGTVFKLPYTVFNSKIKKGYNCNIILSDKRAMAEDIIVEANNGYATIKGKLNMPINMILEVFMR